MSREAVIRQIVEREQQKRGLSEQAVLEDAPSLHQAACEHFGTWNTALKYAGVNLRCLDTKHEYSPQRVIQKIREHCRKGGNPAAVHMRRHDHRLYVAAKLHFGTWERTLVKAGINLQRTSSRSGKVRCINKQAVRDDLRQWQATGHSVRWSDVCLENRALAMAAKRAFGNWQKALVAAGILAAVKPRARLRKWNRESIVAAIQQRHQEGKPMDYKGLARDDCGLLAAARRRFGSWQNALAAAGIAAEIYATGRCTR